ncbi:cupin domain-containing protein [Thermoflavimicrobium dichotomicum]|uniref:Cupin domain-containing protein n=1 Tax=Thermoflavimicrobium dichotomicum TaxID=46223 RepID=A0A1I3Q7Z1_9BACL|nr:cupin domain-containing protein [Thermoflavimicrobium dichotomicum]SFJ30354.1 Cupin domain-containing protein [Thermoflavimicrobium dichotomicum]
MDLKDVYKRVIRRQDVKANWDAFPDFKKATYRYIGTLASKDTSIPPVLMDSEISLGIIEAGPGPQAALHNHEVEEIFMPLEGLWEFFWGPNGEERVTLGPLDVITVPPGVLRGFNNVGGTTGRLLVLQSSAEADGAAFVDKEKLTNITETNS